MTKNEAWQVIDQVLVAYRGTLQEHQHIQAALHIVRQQDESQIIDKKEEVKSEK